jgi:hypothetical protein
VSEWLKELAWKASGRINRLVGSNPTLSAEPGVNVPPSRR